MMAMWRSLYRLTNDQLARWLAVIVCTNVGMYIATLLLVGAEVKGYNEYAIHRRFEDLYLASGSGWIYLCAFLIMCAFFVYSIYSDYWGSKAIYTYMTLPVRREVVYVSRLLVFLLSLLLLTAVQLLSIRSGYGIYVNHIGEYADGQYVMHNGYFLAFIRAPLFRFLLPLGWSGLLSVVLLALALATGIYYTALCERAKRRFGYLISAIAAYGMFNLTRYLLRSDQWNFSYEKLIIDWLILLLTSAMFIWHSLLLIRRGAIA